MRLVLDTDVIRSGLQSVTGASRLLLCGIVERAFVPLVTVATLIEYEDVLMRPSSLAATGMNARDVTEFLDGFLAYAEKVAVRRLVRPSLRDVADAMFVEALINGCGDAIVSFNRRDYLDSDDRLASMGKTVVPVVGPGEALGRLAWRPRPSRLFRFPQH